MVEWWVILAIAAPAWIAGLVAGYAWGSASSVKQIIAMGAMRQAGGMGGLMGGIPGDPNKR